jgi:hypothetical protein
MKSPPIRHFVEYVNSILLKIKKDPLSKQVVLKIGKMRKSFLKYTKQVKATKQTECSITTE